MLRNAQIVKAKVIWSTKPMAVVPVLAVTRQGEQSFVFVVQQQNGMAVAHRTPVVLGDTVGNNYSIASGLNAGDQVIVSGTQFLVDGMPVMPLPGRQPGPAQADRSSKSRWSEPRSATMQADAKHRACGATEQWAAGARVELDAQCGLPSSPQKT